MYNHWSVFWNRGCEIGTCYERTDAHIAGQTIVIDADMVESTRSRSAGALRKRYYLAIATELETLLHRAAVFVVMVRRGSRFADSGRSESAHPQRQDLRKSGFSRRGRSRFVYLHSCRTTFLLPYGLVLKLFTMKES